MSTPAVPISQGQIQRSAEHQVRQSMLKIFRDLPEVQELGEDLRTPEIDLEIKPLQVAAAELQVKIEFETDRALELERKEKEVLLDDDVSLPMSMRSEIQVRQMRAQEWNGQLQEVQGKITALEGEKQAIARSRRETEERNRTAALVRDCLEIAQDDLSMMSDALKELRFTFHKLDPPDGVHPHPLMDRAQNAIKYRFETEILTPLVRNSPAVLWLLKALTDQEKNIPKPVEVEEKEKPKPQEVQVQFKPGVEADCQRCGDRRKDLVQFEGCIICVTCRGHFLAMSMNTSFNDKVSDFGEIVRKECRK